MGSLNSPKEERRNPTHRYNGQIQRRQTEKIGDTTNRYSDHWHLIYVTAEEDRLCRLPRGKRARIHAHIRIHMPDLQEHFQFIGVYWGALRVTRKVLRRTAPEPRRMAPPRRVYIWRVRRLLSPGLFGWVGVKLL